MPPSGAGRESAAGIRRIVNTRRLRSCAISRPKAHGRVLIRNGLVLTMDKEDRLLESGCIRVSADRIRQVSAKPLGPEPGEETIDATDNVVMPGLINTHVHHFQTLLRAVYDHLPLTEYLRYVYQCGEELTAEDCRAAAALGSLEAIRAGCTTVVDHHFLNRGSELAAGTIDGMLGTGVRAVLARTIMDSGEGLPSAIKEDVRSGLASFDELTRAYGDQLSEGELVLMTGPNTPGINASEEVCRETAAFAAERRVSRSAHVAEYVGVRNRIREAYGVDGVIRWLASVNALSEDLLAVHVVQVDRDEVTLLSDHGVKVSHNPFSNLFCGPDIAPVGWMLAAGVAVGLGTDGAANNNGQGILDVMRITRLLERSRPEPFTVDPMAALRMATIDGARALGLDHVIGSIEEGKQADLVILRLDQPHMVPFLRPLAHLASFSKGTDVHTVIVRGRALMKNGHVTSMSQEAALRTAGRAGARLVSRLENSVG